MSRSRLAIRVIAVLGVAALASSAAACPGDLDGDSEVGFQDLLVLLSSWGPCEGCASDLDESGEVDIVDLVTLTGTWRWNVDDGWGDCPAGCICHRRYEAEIHADGTFDLVSVEEVGPDSICHFDDTP